jgi:hypothetical protein
MSSLRSLLVRARAAVIVGAIVVVGGCGGSSQSKSNTSTGATHSSTAPTSAGSASSTGTAAPSPSGAASVTTGPVRGTLTGANHAPIAGKGWPYTVKVTDANGKPLSGTVDIEFLLDAVVVGHDKPPTHPVKDGTWHDILTFPPQAAIGQTLTLQAVVHTSAGSITLDWPVDVKR